ncbi:DNA-binding transcriptional MerR regulator [Ancylobacter aquaticus]|uniref:DNA-binding transcriptional MerR regulator n=1 Tax=Ancylobacter aquaticus TaxID=100 RepID=A0A4R1I3N4_ANCAQ|nr:DNA-binding transcriptional MerR regulator [Ancylobacter aquaticus]
MNARQEQPGGEKGPDAFRTISEVAEDLDLPQHVLRFWETRFPQIRPLKRGGGRRYYRPDDVELLRGIRHLLYGEGYTIRGVQRILKEEGPRYVQAIWRDIEADDQAIAERDDRDGHSTYAPAPLPPIDVASTPAPDDVPARAPPASGTAGGPLGGILNLLPGRQREPAEENPARRARRRPDSEPDHLDLPLLADLEPPVRPSRSEPPPLATDSLMRFEPLPPLDRGAPEPQPATPSTEPRPAQEPRPPELRASFPFRPIGPGPVSEAPDDEVSFVPERARAAMPTEAPYQAAVSAVRPVLPAASALRAGGVQADETPAPTTLSREDVLRLQAALYELQDCQRLLDTARDRDG